jgi:hypothetical protein
MVDRSKFGKREKKVKNLESKLQLDFVTLMFPRYAIYSAGLA